MSTASLSRVLSGEQLPRPELLRSLDETLHLRPAESEKIARMWRAAAEARARDRRPPSTAPHDDPVHLLQELHAALGNPPLRTLEEWTGAGRSTLQRALTGEAPESTVRQVLHLLYTLAPSSVREKSSYRPDADHRPETTEASTASTEFDEAVQFAQAAAGFLELSPQESAMLSAMVSGKTILEIAQAQSISPASASRALHRIQAKMTSMATTDTAPLYWTQNTAAGREADRVFADFVRSLRRMRNLIAHGDGAEFDPLFVNHVQKLSVMVERSEAGGSATRPVGLTATQGRPRSVRRATPDGIVNDPDVQLAVPKVTPETRRTGVPRRGTTSRRKRQEET